MMRVFVALGDKETETWLKQALGVQYTEDLEHATHALLSRLSDARRAKDLGVEVKLVVMATEVGERLAQAAAAFGIQDVVRVGKETRADDLFSCLIGVEPPTVTVTHQPPTLLITSAPASGGTFLAWNFHAALTQSGKRGALIALSKRSPLSKWLPEPPEWLVQALHEAPTDADFWIVDASDATVPESPSVVADAHLHVVDADPAKWIEPPGARWVCNRWPESEEVPENSVLVISDFGREQFLAMRSGVAVCTTVGNEDFAEALLGVYADWVGGSVEHPVAVFETADDVPEALDGMEETNEDVPYADETVEGFDLEG